jgi:hypothetical protein
MIMRSVAGFLFLVFALTAPTLTSALAQAPETSTEPAIPDAKTLAADYELTNAPGDKKCAVTLELKPVAAGYLLAYDHAQCRPLFGFLLETVAWLPGIAGSIRLVNSAKQTVAEFTEGVGGQYEALLEGDGVYFLSNLQFVNPSDVPQFSDVVGDWNISRPDGPAICSLRLTEQTAGEGLFAVTVKPGCDPSIVSFGPSKWFMDRGDIVFLSVKDARMRFGRQPEGDWVKIPERPSPLRMTRPESK